MILTGTGVSLSSVQECLLAASDLFHLFTQLINFYTFHFQYRCLKNVIQQIDSKNGLLLLLESLRQNLG